MCSRFLRCSRQAVPNCPIFPRNDVVVVVVVIFLGSFQKKGGKKINPDCRIIGPYGLPAPMSGSSFWGTVVKPGKAGTPLRTKASQLTMVLKQVCYLWR